MPLTFAYSNFDIGTETPRMNYSNLTHLSGTSKKEETFPQIPLGSFIGISVACSGCIGIFANLVVLLVLTISQRKRFSPYRYLISHLAFSDLMCSILLLVYAPLELEGHQWIYAEGACKLVYPSITFFTNLSVGTILMIAFERHRGVILIHRSPWKPCDIWKALMIVWLFGFIIIIPNIISIKVTSYKNLEYCNENWGDSSLLQKVYGISFFFIAFFIPLIAIIVMHVQIMVRLQRRDLRPANISQYTKKMDARIMRVLTAIIIAFFICSAPNKLLYFVWDVAPHLEKSETTNIRYYLRTVQFLYYLRVAVNPLLYCFFDTRFKKDFKNSTKIIRGLSFVDSDIQSRSRARTLSQQRFSVVINGNVRSRTSSCLSDGNPFECKGECLQSELTSKLACVHEIETSTCHVPPTSIHNNIVGEIELDSRYRSDSCGTEQHSVYGSASPLVSPTYMTDLTERKEK